MTQITLYTGNGISLSPVYEDGRVESTYVRLVAEENMMLKNGEITAICIDIPKTEMADWGEVEFIESEPEPDAEEILNILIGGSNE